MKSSEFAIWLKGFVEACNNSYPTQAQWDKIKEELTTVGEPTPYEIPKISFSTSGTINGNSSTSVANYPPYTNIDYTTKHQLND